VKTKLFLPLFIIIFLGSWFDVQGQGTVFTYQGRIQTNDTPFNGNAELEFSLWDAATGGNKLATNTPLSVIVGVTNGLFSAPVDFGASAFNGQSRWLQIDLRTTIGPFTTILPRQLLTPAPYALYSAGAASATAVTGPIPDSLLSANIARLQSSPAFTGTVSGVSFKGNGAALTGINHLDSPGGGPAGALRLDAQGHVGIGTNNSGAALQVAGGGAYSNPIFQGALTNNSAGVTNMGSPVNVFVAGTKAYVTSFSPGALEIFDISNPLQAVLAGEAVNVSINPSSPFKHLNGGDGIFVTNNIAYYTAELDNALTIIDVSNPGSPTELAEVVNNVGGVTNLNLPTDVLVSGHYAFVLSFISSSLSIFDVANPANPILVKQILDDSVLPGSPFTKLQWPYQMTLAGTKLYIAARGDNAVSIVDVATPTNPKLVAEIVDASVDPSSPFTGLRNANWVDVVSNVAYVAAGAFNSSLGSLTIIDVSNPAKPLKLAQIDDNVVQANSPFKHLAGAWGVRVAGNTAYVTCFADNAVTAIDVSDPTHPQLLKEFVNGKDGINTLNFTEGLTRAGDVLYVIGDSSSALNMFTLHSTLGLKVDAFVGIGTATPRTALDVAGTVSAESFQWGSDGQLTSDQGGSMELGDSTVSNSTPYIDFHYGVGVPQDYNVRLINDGPGQLSLLGNLGVSGALVVDNANANDGVLAPGLTFGSSSGEGIASKRTAGVDQFGLDFYTAFQPRVTIANDGSVGIGTTTPTDALLDVEGDTHINDFSIYLRADSDRNHGLGWRANFAGQFVDGPALFGFSGGVLGTTGGGENWSLLWDNSGQVFTRGAINPTSDRNLKANFQPVDRAEVLNKVAALPVSEWNYKDDPGTRHIGPMAQDFYAAFGLGTDDKHIATVDADGVALAAIQALNAKLQEKESEIRKLELRLQQLEKLVKAGSTRDAN
jgi:hypothetical protein